jgi:hypothetical protein
VYLGDLVRPAALDVVEIDPFLAERTLPYISERQSFSMRW